MIAARGAEQAPGNRGFTLLELLVALVTGVIVLSAATSFAVATLRSVEANQRREGVHRSARFLAMSFERDFQATGVGLAATPSFGTLTVQADTIVILSAAFHPDEADPHDLDPPPGTDNPLAPGGTCGPRCLNVLKGSGEFDLEVGDLARLQVNDERRLILLESVGGGGSSRTLGFTSQTELLDHSVGFAGGLLLDRFGTFVQKLAPIVYYLNGNQLMRAASVNLDGSPAGDVIAEGVMSFDVTLLFVDGDEADEANPNDSDPTNDFDDVAGVRIRVELAADRPHTLGGSPYTRSYQWQFSPRNLMYERNR